MRDLALSLNQGNGGLFIILPSFLQVGIQMQWLELE